jgi:hypothetical protein
VDILASFDDVTMVPIVKALHLLIWHSDDDILRLFHHVQTSSFFRFTGQFYEQTSGVTMGLPLSPVIANFFMEHFEETNREGANHKLFASFTMWMTHSLSGINGPCKLSELLDHLNSVHENIQFTMETERDSHRLFFDTDTYHKPDGSLGHKVYHKPIHTNLHLDFNSHHNPSNKQAVLSMLVHRARFLCDQDILHSKYAE